MRFLILMMVIICSFSAGTSFIYGAEPERTLIRFGGNFNIRSVITTDAKVTRSEGTLQIETGHKNPWPGITIKAPKGKWDLSKYEYISIPIKNVGDKKVTVDCRVDNPGADGIKNCVTDRITLDPGKKGTLIVRLLLSRWKLSEPLELIGMRGYPVHSGKVDPSNITQILVFIAKPAVDYRFEIGDICAGGQIEFVDAKTFIPFIDEFGQYIHGDWPGKTHSQEELIAHGKEEQKDLAAHPGPSDRNRYGGWTAGPKLDATGFFRVEKYEGKWWLIDPEGRLFWSHGIDCVRENNDTPISDREHYWKWLPKKGSDYAVFYGSGSWAPHGYYKDHKPFRTYDFSRANFLRKYGYNWRDMFADITHQRLRSWGMNTIANWSQSSIYFMRRTPYVGTVYFQARWLEGSTGYWGKFYDVFDPSFRGNMRKSMRRFIGKEANDPWCFGFFVHNELAWGDEVSLALAALKSPANQPAKKVFIADLKKKYVNINKLNKVWGTKYASWDDLRTSTNEPDKKKAWDDLTTFYTKTAETYFKTIREEFKKVAPNQLYMGCRFAWVNDRAARAAAKYCDVVCYNQYKYDVEGFRMPDGIDMPIIIGEFHFGALDRGMFHTGLRRTANQDDRAEKYRSYVQSALRNPYIVGTHWFQYKDQATTGRGDGENYQIGFIDICDKPYPEIVRACRDVGYKMYEYRLKTK